MFLNTLRSWLNGNSKKAQRRRRTGDAMPTLRPAKRFRPVLEALESRVVPSTIKWVNRDGPLFNSGGAFDNGFHRVFGADSDLAKRTVDAALLAWQNMIVDLNGLDTLPVNISMGPMSGFGAVASQKVGLNLHPINGTITIQSGTAGVPDGGWYLDPTPQYAEEFRGDLSSGNGMGSIVNPYFAGPTPGGPADGKSDLYSIVAVEMVHVLGIADNPALLFSFDPNGYFLKSRGTDSVDNPGKLVAFRSPNVDTLFTTYNSGNGGEDRGSPVHVARPGKDNLVTVNGGNFKGVYYGATDTGNAIYDNGRYQPSYLDALVLQDVYGYKIVPPTDKSMYVNFDPGTGNLLVRGGTSTESFYGSAASDDNITFGWSYLNNVPYLDVYVQIGSPVKGTGPNRVYQNQFAVSMIKSITVKGGDGNDTITIGRPGGSTYFIPPVTVDGGTGTDSVIVDDGADFATYRYTVTNSTVTRNTGFGGLTYANAEKLTLVTGPNIASPLSTVNVESTAKATPVTITGGGYFNVNVGKAGNVYDRIRGDVIVTPSGAGKAALNVNAAADLGGTVTITNRTITGLAPATIGYGPSGLSALTISAGLFDSTTIINSTPNAPVTLNTGSGDDVVFVRATSGSLTVNGQAGADTVNIGLAGSVQGIGSPLTVTNAGGYSAVAVDDSADTIARTVILYNNGSATVISGLAPGGDINLARTDLSSLLLSAGSGGNTFRIHDTLLGYFDDGESIRPTLTSVNTGAAGDNVTVDGTTGALVLDVQAAKQRPNSITVGSPTTGINGINGRIDITGRAGAATSLSITDAASTVSRAYVMGANFVQRFDKARIGFENLSDLTLQAGGQTDTIDVQDTMQVGPGHSTMIAPSGGTDAINVSRTTGTLLISPGSSSVITVGNATNSLDGIQGAISVTPGPGSNVTLILNDQAATTPQQLDVAPNFFGTTYRRSGAADIAVGANPLGSFQWFGGSGGNTINVKAQPGTGSIFMLGAGDDVLNDGTAANTLVAGALDTGTMTVIGGTGTDQLLIRDQGTTTARRYDLSVGQFVGQESRGGISARPLNSLSNTQTVIFDQLESVTLKAGSGGNLVQITGSPAATSVLINTGAGADTVDVGSGNNSAFGPPNQLRDFRGPLTLDGQAGQDQLTFNDQGTTSLQYYNLVADQLTRTDANSVVDMAPISFADFKTVTLNGSRGGSVVFVEGTAAGVTTTANGQPGAADTFAVGFAADTSKILGPVRFNGQAADNDFAYYYDSFNPNPQAYNVSIHPSLPQGLLVDSTGAAPVTFNDLSEIIFSTPLVGGSTVNIKGVPAQMVLLPIVTDGDAVRLGSRAPNLGGTLANILGPVAVVTYSPDNVVTLVLDDSGNADLTPKHVTFTPAAADDPTDFDHVVGFAPGTVQWRNLGASSSITLRGGAADETFALTSTAFTPAISIDGGGGVNTLDYSRDAAPTSGLVSWYKAEGDANDAIGGNNGVAVGNVQYAQGKVGQTFSFNGVDSYIQVPNSPALESANISVEAWVNGTNLPLFVHIMAKGDNGFLLPSYSLSTWDSGGLRFEVTDGTTNATSPDPGAAIWDGNWHHVVGTYDGASVRLYVDGAEVGGGTPTNIVIAYGLPNENDLFIGSNATGEPRFDFPGLIDELSVYNRALSAADVQAIYSAGSAGKSGVSYGVEVNLPLGAASGLTGGIAKIQNVIGSAGNDILVGNGGNVLSGGAGRDLLIAGTSASTLNGGGDEDILIGGTTNYDRNAAALKALLAEWTSNNDYATRVANLKNGTNGAPVLNGTTVRSNGRRNTLNGNAGLDFFFANLARDTLDRDPLNEELVAL